MPEITCAPPQSKLTAAPHTKEHPPFYVVSRAKFLTLFIFSIGLYQLYWAYKNWKQVERSHGKKLWPVARALFILFFTHALYREADARLKRDGSSFQWRPNWLATLFVVGMLVNNTVDALVRREIGYPLTDIASLLLLPVTAWLTWLGQRGLNAAAGDPEGRSNARFTLLNYVIIVVGAVLLVLACIGVTIPPQ